MKIKTSELSGIALDWAVALCEGYRFLSPYSFIAYHDEEGQFWYSTLWMKGGPIIEREHIGLWDSADKLHQGEWAAADLEWLNMDTESEEFLTSSMPYHGTTALIAAMRCYVASKLGEEVDIPEELLK